MSSRKKRNPGVLVLFYCWQITLTLHLALHSFSPLRLSCMPAVHSPCSTSPRSPPAWSSPMIITLSKSTGKTGCQLSDAQYFRSPVRFVASVFQSRYLVLSNKYDKEHLDRLRIVHSTCPAQSILSNILGQRSSKLIPRANHGGLVQHTK
ncbi:hypothetical protein BDW62DRAFT_174728, partial [Aspergillus aurantiobrunneus]